MEEWREIKGVNGQYFVSNEGRVKSVDRIIADKNGRMVRHKGRILRGSNNGAGYWKVDLKVDGLRHAYIHRLVAEAFIPKLPGKNFINHKDFDPSNNRVENLEWVTPKENTTYSLERGRYERTDEWLANLKNGAVRAQGKSVIGINIKDGTEILLEALNDCAKLGFSPSCVSHCCNGKGEQHKGYTWRFAETNGF